jgi:hypothetical protein
MSLIPDTEEHRLIRESVGAIAAGGGPYRDLLLPTAGIGKLSCRVR